MSKTILIQRNPERPGIEVPAKYVVCHDCDGEGSVLHEAIRNHAYGWDEFNESFDDEEAAEYFKGGQGRYGVQCETCKGDRVVLAVDEDRLTRRQRIIVDAYEQGQADIAMWDRADAYTRRQESGGY